MRLDARWRDFPAFVWFHGGPARGERPFATLRAAGFDGVNLEASAESPEGAAARAASLDVYVDHLAGKGDLWLRPAAFDRDRDAWKSDLLGFRPARPAPFFDPAVRQRLAQRVAAGVERHRASDPLGWVLDDELSVTRGVNPMDYCFAPSSLAAFRDRLLRRYGSLAGVNRAWRSEWTRLDDLLPPTTGAARRAADGKPVASLELTAWNDHRAFMEEALCELLSELAAPVRAADPAAPIGFTGGAFPSAFGGFDWARLAPALTLHEPYETGAAPELVHAFKQAGARVLSTLFVPDEPVAGWQSRELLARVARGDDGVVVWSSGPLLNDAGDALTAAGREVAQELAAARELRRAIVDAADAPPNFFVLSSQAAARAGWMVDSWVDGKTFPNRLTSYESERSSTATAREAWVACLRSIGAAWRFIDDRAGLPAEAIAAPERSVVVLSEAFALPEALVAPLVEFVAAGGTLVGDAHAALFDDALDGRDGRALEALFGVRRDPAATLDDLGASVADDATRGGEWSLPEAEGDALVAAEGTERSALGFERRLGRGRTLYLDRRMGACVRGAEAGESLRATVVAWRGWLGKQVPVAAGIELDRESIGAVVIRPIVRAGKAAWIVAPTARLGAAREVALRRSGTPFSSVERFGAAAGAAGGATAGDAGGGATLRLPLVPGGAYVLE